VVGAIIGTRCRDDGLEFGLLGGEFVKIRIGLGVGGVDLLQARLRSLDLTHATFHRLAHGVLRFELRLLGQVADLDARHGRGFALDFGVHPRHDLQQRGLAGTVQAQHANLGAGEKAEGNILENLTLGRHDLADAVHGEDVLGHGIALSENKQPGRRTRPGNHQIMAGSDPPLRFVRE